MPRKRAATKKSLRRKKRSLRASGYVNFLKMYQLIQKKVKFSENKTWPMPTALHTMRAAIDECGRLIPWTYREAYAKPLCEQFDAVDGFIFNQELFGALFDHHDYYSQVRNQTRCLMAVSSNL